MSSRVKFEPSLSGGPNLEQQAAAADSTHEQLSFLPSYLHRPCTAMFFTKAQPGSHPSPAGYVSPSVILPFPKKSAARNKQTGV
ncbi:uncharacterized protein AKAME5_000482300 [Lates japonicus]|uniref:Uncharacterized protein n=1 Tax=Lates japonicus TaxID=270547 RepID=A0AAD3MCE9_LATJO|nr:uncharacterized protein AKAME5_000482300 [Lates japonicus]